MNHWDGVKNWTRSENMWYMMSHQIYYEQVSINTEGENLSN